MTVSSAARSVRATLQYFDMFDHPLTLMEIARYLYRFPDQADEPLPQLSEISAALAEIGAGERDGFFFLPGRAEDVTVRERRFRLAEPKFRRARQVARWMRLLPGVRLVAICNSLALANAGEESDIDLFVVVRPSTIWITRLITVGALAAFGLRPDARTSADKVCMSFFVSERALDLSVVALRPDDTYLRYWVASLLPLYDAGGATTEFLSANSWVGERVPGALAPRRLLADRPPWYSALLLPLLRALDVPARWLQRRLFPTAISGGGGQDGSVVVTDDMLKFHVADARRDFENDFRNRLNQPA